MEDWTLWEWTQRLIRLNAQHPIYSELFKIVIDRRLVLFIVDTKWKMKNNPRGLNLANKLDEDAIRLMHTFTLKQLFDSLIRTNR